MKNYDKLINTLLSVVKFNNLPDTIDSTFLLYNLVERGYIVICKHNEELLSLSGAISGVSMYSLPTTYTIANPVIRSEKTYHIGEDCVVIYASKHRNINLAYLKNILLEYAKRLDEIDISIERAIKNTRIMRTFTADTPQAYSAIVEKLNIEKNADVSAQVIPSDILSNIQVHLSPIKQQYVLDMLLRDKSAIINEFLSLIGVNTTPYEKKERLLNDEVNSNNEYIEINRSGLIDWLNEQFSEVNRIFNQNISCEYNIRTTQEEVVETVEDIPTDEGVEVVESD